MISYCVISDSKKVETNQNIEKRKVAVIVHLFYEEQIDFYRTYLEKIPSFIDVIVISSKNVILEYFSLYGIKTIKKENRGRDISALLVIGKEIVFQYEYICFIHDKKEKDVSKKEDVANWKKNLWDNMLQSDIYVYNLLEFMENDKLTGMFVPLPPHGRNMEMWLYASWGENCVNTQKLADELNVKANICEERPPYTYGTVFWAKTEVLKKLYTKDWSYEDFPEEPMQDDGEINHAIERVLQYVVEDAGYKVKIVLSSSFAGYFIGQLHDELCGLWKQIESIFGVRNYDGLDTYNVRVKKIKKFAKEHADIYLYGGGRVGRNCLKVCHSLNIFPKGIIVTSVGDTTDVKEKEIPIISINDVRLKQSTGIIVSVGNNWKAEIIEELEKRSFNQYLLFE